MLETLRLRYPALYLASASVALPLICLPIILGLPENRSLSLISTLAFIAAHLRQEARRLEPSVRYGDDIPAKRDREEYVKIGAAIILIEELARLPDPRTESHAII